MIFQQALFEAKNAGPALNGKIRRRERSVQSKELNEEFVLERLAGRQCYLAEN